MPPLILITRPRDAARALADDLRVELGGAAEICIAPLLEIEHLSALPDLGSVKTLVFTSSHAVASFCAASPRRDFACYAVGAATAAAARAQGFTPIAGPGTGEALADLILIEKPPTPCLYLRGDHVAFDIAAALNAGGLETRSAVIYRQTPMPLPETLRTRLENGQSVLAPVFSPRSARLLLDAVPGEVDLHIAAISQNVANVFPEERISRLGVAATPDRPAMIACIRALWHDAQSP